VAAALVAALLLGGAPTAPAQTAEDPRAVAREILGEKRFRASRVPRPFAGVLRWLGERLRPLRELFDDVAVRIPGGSATLWLVIAAIVVIAAAALARRTIGASAGAEGRARRAALARRADPGELERDAARAEKAGDWELAVRLRMRAGLLRLDARELLEYRPSLTTGEVARTLHSPAFERVGEDFDAIAYGGRQAAQADADASREGWQRVLAEAGPA